MRNHPFIKRYCCCALIGLFLSVEISAEPNQYFRYRTSNGMVVIDNRLPPEVVKFGYEVINDLGAVLLTVPPAATPAEIEAKRELMAARRLAEQQRKQDEMLLTRYSSTADIKAAEQRVSDEIDLRITILRSNIRSVRSQLERQQETAANTERAGRKVPEKLVNNIDVMEVEIDELRTKIEARKLEVAEVRNTFRQQAERFEYLQDVRYGRVPASQDDSKAKLAAD